MDQSYAGNRKDLADRPRQVSVVLSYMLTTWTEHDRLDSGRVGMFGFSLGGFTTLVLSDGNFRRRRIHICKSTADDPEKSLVSTKNSTALQELACTIGFAGIPASDVGCAV